MEPPCPELLAALRRSQEQGPVKILIERFLEDQQNATPPVPDWRLRQMRQALEVFGRGVDNWHFEAEPDGRVRARRPARLPVVLSREEVKRVLGAMEGTPQLIGRLSSALLCDASAGEGNRHQDCAGLPGPQERGDDTDLYARHAETGAGGEEKGRRRKEEG